MKNQSDLSEVLQTWNPQQAMDSSFNRHVWLRIEAQENMKISVADVVSGWLQFLMLPKPAVAAVAFAILSGVLIGGIQAHSTQEARYMASLNPFSSLSHRS